MVEQTPIPFQTPAALSPYSQIGVDYGNNNGETFLGPIESGGGRYFVLFGRTDGSSDVTIRVTKSVDSGATWATQDIANEPDVEFAGGLDVTTFGTDIFIVYASTLAAIREITFSMATDTYGSPTADKSFASTVSLVNLRAVRVSNGDIFAFFDVNDFPGIQYAKLSGGVWGANQSIEAGGGSDSYRLLSVVIDSTDLMHVFYQTRINTGSTRQLSYRSLTTAGTLGSRVTVASQVNVDWNIGHVSVWGDNLVIPASPVSSSLKAGVFVGAGLASPVFASFVLLDTNTQMFGFSDLYLYSFTSQDGVTDYVFWSSQAGIGNNSELDAIYYSSNLGMGWSAPVLFYDANSFPPPETIAPDDQFIHRISIAVLNSGLFGTAVNLESSAFDGACIGFTLIDSTGGELAISCNNPPPGTVGQPYTHDLLASGGTPPYTFAVTVGALPDGLTLDASTGEISGTPTVDDTFPFTVQVTDDVDDTATVECSITIVAAPSELPTIICDNPPVGIVGTFYTHDFPASGGTPPYTFEITAGSLPPGLALNDDTGNISGTPTVNGIFPFTVTVTDSGNLTASVECSITIRKRCLLEQVTS